MATVTVCDGCGHCVHDAESVTIAFKGRKLTIHSDRPMCDVRAKNKVRRSLGLPTEPEKVKVDRKWGIGMVRTYST